MLATVGAVSLDALIDEIVPADIRRTTPLLLPDAETEFEYHQRLRAIAGKNRVYRSYIGLGYHDTITPAVIQRNVFENPGWYTPYTPYQAEIAQGRLESLLNFQTMVTRFDRDGGGERVAARRSDGRGRGDRPDAPRQQEARRQGAPGRRTRLSASHAPSSPPAPKCSA